MSAFQIPDFENPEALNAEKVFWMFESPEDGDRDRAKRARSDDDESPKKRAKREATKLVAGFDGMIHIRAHPGKAK